MKYVRFKNIPPDELSNIYDGDAGIIGKELGVSCFEFIEMDGFIKILLSSIDTGIINDLSYFCGELIDGKIPAYIIEADKVGIGTYGEPVVKNVVILYELEIVQLVDPPPKYKLDKSDRQLRIKS